MVGNWGAHNIWRQGCGKSVTYMPAGSFLFARTRKKSLLKIREKLHLYGGYRLPAGSAADRVRYARDAGGTKRKCAEEGRAGQGRE